MTGWPKSVILITFSSINSVFSVNRGCLAPEITFCSWNLYFRMNTLEILLKTYRIKSLSRLSISERNLIPSFLSKMNSFINQDPFAHHIFLISASKIFRFCRTFWMTDIEFSILESMAKERTKVFAKNLMDIEETVCDNVLGINIEIPLKMPGLTQLRSFRLNFSLK